MQLIVFITDTGNVQHKPNGYTVFHKQPFWNEELDRLKHDSIFWHNLWVDAGRPSSGVLQTIRLSCKAKYKLGIRNAYSLFENKMSDEMCHHFMNKRVPEFWKTWNVKFRKNVTKNVNININIKYYY